MSFAQCLEDQLGQDMFPALGELCLFSNTQATSMTYIVVMQDIMSRALLTCWQTGLYACQQWVMATSCSDTLGAGGVVCSRARNAPYTHLRCSVLTH